MGAPGPINQSPIGSNNNKFTLDSGTISLTKSRIPGPISLYYDPWPAINLYPHNSFINALQNSFTIDLFTNN